MKPIALNVEKKLPLIFVLLGKITVIKIIEVIKHEATEHPKVIKSVTELTKSITELETYIDELETKQNLLEQKTTNIKIAYGAGGTIGGIVGTIALWKVLPKVKKWLEL